MRRFVILVLAFAFAAGPAMAAATPCLSLEPAASVAKDCMSAMLEKHELPVQKCNDCCAALVAHAAVVPLWPELVIIVSAHLQLFPDAAPRLAAVEPPDTLRPPRTLA